MRAYAIILDSYGYDHRENGLLVSIVKEIGAGISHTRRWNASNTKNMVIYVQ